MMIGAFYSMQPFYINNLNHYFKLHIVLHLGAKMG